MYLAGSTGLTGLDNIAGTDRIRKNKNNRFTVAPDIFA
jgi:hypothetical protein